MKKFKFIEQDHNKLPITKGKNVNGFRFYDIDGQAFPSVTSVLSIGKKEGLQKWRESVGEGAANWEMGRAARRGKATHTLVEQYLKGETPSERSVLPLGLFKLLKPYVDQIDNVRMLETIMYSKQLTLAGQVDCIADYNGKLSVIDFKTANKAREESWIDNYFLQTTAYSIMYEETFGQKIDQIVILLASEDGSAQSFVKKTEDYKAPLKKAIEDFYKYYEEANKSQK
jgi:genome maintenance exonuclease 1